MLMKIVSQLLFFIIVLDNSKQNQEYDEDGMYTSAVVCDL